MLTRPNTVYLLDRGGVYDLVNVDSLHVLAGDTERVGTVCLPRERLATFFRGKSSRVVARRGW